MSESLQHQQLVKLIIDTTISIVGKDNTVLIATDAVDGYTLPPLTSEDSALMFITAIKICLYLGKPKQVRTLNACTVESSMNHI